MEEINPSPCYFLEFSLENVRCFGQNQRIDFRDADGRPSRWTVILGDNGVGKTTLLQCLWLMSPVTYQREPGILAGTVTRSTHRIQWPGEFARSMVEVLARDGEQYRMSMGAVIDDGTAPPNFFSLLEHRHARGISGSQLPELAISMVCVAYGASRKPGGGQVTAKADWDAATLFEEGKFLVDAEEGYLRSDYAAKSEATGRAVKRHDDVRQILLALLDVEDLRVTGLDQPVAKPSVEARTPTGWIPLRGFSLGYRTSIAWIVDFALRLYERYSDSENPLHEPAVCLVDEIDLHLHPRWQRQLIEFLSRQFPATQFIVTAHSPLVVQAAEDANAKVVVLRYDEDVGYVTIDDDVQEVRGWRVDQILTSELFGLESSRSSTANKLFERRAALVMKGRLDADEQAELERIDAEIDSLPVGDSAQQRHAWDVLQRIATHLESREDAGE